MAVRREDGLVAYRSRPPRTDQRGGHDIVVRPGAALDPPVGGALDRFLAARWGAYHRRGTLLYTPVEHPPWPLHHADLETCEVAELFTPVDLPAPTGPPLVHWSPGVEVEVEVGRPRLAT